MNILFWNFEPSSKMSSRLESIHKFCYNILFTFLMDCGRAPNGIGHLWHYFHMIQFPKWRWCQNWRHNFLNQWLTPYKTQLGMLPYDGSTRPCWLKWHISLQRCLVRGIALSSLLSCRLPANFNSRGSTVAPTWAHLCWPGSRSVHGSIQSCVIGHALRGRATWSIVSDVSPGHAGRRAWTRAHYQGSLLRPWPQKMAVFSGQRWRLDPQFTCAYKDLCR